MTKSLIAILAVFILPLGCGRKPEPKKNPPLQAPSPALRPALPKQTLDFNNLLENASADESYFIGVCRILLTQSVLLPLDGVPEHAAGEAPKKISIKVLKTPEDTGPGTVMIFSGKQALAQAGDRLKWVKNDKGMYSFAALNGQAAFRVFEANGYDRVILDVAAVHPLPLNKQAIRDLAAGKIPDFPAKK